MSVEIPSKTNIVIYEKVTPEGYIRHTKDYFCRRTHNSEFPIYENLYEGYSIKYYNKDNLLHRDGDLPAYQKYMQDKLAYQYWYKNGKCIKVAGKYNPY